MPEYPGRYDAALRRKSKRSRRETGCWLYIPAETLEASGYDPHGPAPFYRVWPGTRGGVRVRLYRER